MPDSDYRRKQKSNILARAISNAGSAVAVAVKNGQADYSLKPKLVVDLSNWERGMVIADMKPFPSMVIGRATLGKGYVDPSHPEFYKQCRMLDEPYDAFHFFMPNDVQPQIDNYLKAMEPFGWDKWPPLLDLEYDPGPWPKGIRGEQLADQVHFWLLGVEQRTGKRPVVYTNANFWSFLFYDPTGQHNQQNIQAPTWTKDYLAWLGWYPTFPDAFAVPPVGAKKIWPTGFLEWWLWQYAMNGRSNGYPANDLNTPGAALASLLV